MVSLNPTPCSVNSTLNSAHSFIPVMFCVCIDGHSYVFHKRENGAAAYFHFLLVWWGAYRQWFTGHINTSVECEYRKMYSYPYRYVSIPCCLFVLCTFPIKYVLLMLRLPSHGFCIQQEALLHKRWRNNYQARYIIIKECVVCWQLMTDVLCSMHWLAMMELEWRVEQDDSDTDWDQLEPTFNFIWRFNAHQRSGTQFCGSEKRNTSSFDLSDDRYRCHAYKDAF